MLPESNFNSEKPNESENFPDLIFIIKSSSIKFSGYDFKNIPVSTGRADVLARLILAGISEPSGLSDSVGIWLFFNDNLFHELSEYFTTVDNESKFDGKSLPLEPFSVLITSHSGFFKENKVLGKKSFTEYDIISSLYRSFEQIQNVNFKQSLFYRILPGNFSNQMINLTKTKRKCYILEEDAEIDLLQNNIFANGESKEKYAFLIGDQIGFPEDFDKVKGLFKKLSIGIKSQLASTIISLIKFKIL